MRDLYAREPLYLSLLSVFRATRLRGMCGRGRGDLRKTRAKTHRYKAGGGDQKRTEKYDQNHGVVSRRALWRGGDFSGGFWWARKGRRRGVSPAGRKGRGLQVKVKVCPVCGEGGCGAERQSLFFFGPHFYMLLRFAAQLRRLHFFSFVAVFWILTIN